MNDNEVRKAPDALERVPEMLDTPPNRYHCISKTPQQTLGAFFYHLSNTLMDLTNSRKRPEQVVQVFYVS
ncbi:hypothetical protein [Streptococcus suis]|uniref:hypothetical protein n=1 Tax=Streptococcus suis TaxID=1307 RepID=UPI00191675E9|nr:hypothetical protein [Streptococcus suis]